MMKHRKTILIVIAAVVAINVAAYFWTSRASADALVRIGNDGGPT